MQDENDEDGEPLILLAPDDSAGETVTTSGLLGGEHVLLISGAAPYFGKNVKVAIDYTFGGDRVSKPFTTGRPETFTPRPGVKYTAQLNFVGNAFVLQFVVDNGETWEDGESDNDGDVVFE